MCVSECVRYIYAYVRAPMLGLSKEAWATNLCEDLGAGGHWIMCFTKHFNDYKLDIVETFFSTVPLANEDV